MKEKLGPAANEKALAAARRQEKYTQFQQKEDLQWLMNQPQFRRWAIVHIYGMCGVNKMIWDSSSRIHMLEGRRSIGIDTLSTFTQFPELYSQFEHERVEAECEQLTRVATRAEDDEDAS